MADTTFYAKLKLTGRTPESVLLTFASAKIADQWFSIITGHSWPGELNIKSNEAKRQNPQWFTWANSDKGAKTAMQLLENHDQMKPVKGSWDWKLYSDADEPVIPAQKADGTKDTTDIEKKMADLEARLAAAEKKGAEVATAAAGSNALVATNAANWLGPPRFQGGVATQAMATDAFRMAVECKDRGDNRGFGMIFAQLFMEQRRTVGVGERDTLPEGGYNSAALIKRIYEQAKQLQDKGDDRPFGLIFASVSMAYRRGKVAW